MNWILPFEFFACLSSPHSSRPAEVHLFGFSYVWHGLRDMIEHLKERSQVSIYTLAPFVEFAEDLATINVTTAAGPWFSRRHCQESTPRPTEIVLRLARRTFAFVAQWGRPGREYFGMLAQIASS